MIHDIMRRPTRTERLAIASPAHLQEILIHLREQWHTLVKTDNLLGPRFALAGVLNQISVLEALRSILRDEQRIEVTRIGAKYAESAAWLYEETDNLTQARSWTSQAMEWAYEGDDERMLAWTIFRRAQQAAAIPDAAQTIGLAQAARRDEEILATPTKAAIRVQEAYGHALDGNDQAAQRLLDEAHTWAAGDTVGDAREGHGSYCTPDYIEIQRATCWLAAGQPKKAISLYEHNLRTLPTVYQQNRAAGLTRLAVAYAADNQPEQAANTAHAALPVARSSGSKRVVGEIKSVGTKLIPYRAVPAVAALLDELEAEDH
jgi:tetratricopeptide (TPR) repeat protein